MAMSKQKDTDHNHIIRDRKSQMAGVLTRTNFKFTIPHQQGNKITEWSKKNSAKMLRHTAQRH